MKKIEELWPERVQAFIKEIRRYMKYILNDHIKFVLIFGAGAAIYYYSEWVKRIPDDFPFGIVMALVLGVALTASPVITLLQEPDKIFLMPLEKKLTGFFRKGMRLSFTIQAYLLLLILAAMMPLYFRMTGNGMTFFLFFLIVLLMMKIWNMSIHWMSLKMTEKSAEIMDMVIRGALNMLMLYFLFSGASWWFPAAVLAIIAGYSLFAYSFTRGKPLNWQLLIDKEQSRMQGFYRTANMFTDVPHIGAKAKRRRWLDPLFRSRTYGKTSIFGFLFSRTIVRSREYSGLIIRLTIIGFIILLLIGNPYASIVVSLLFLYLTGFQLLPLVRYHEQKIWTQLYPVSQKEKLLAFGNILFSVLAIQAVLFGAAIMIGGHLIYGMIGAAAAIFFAYLFSKQYAPSRLKKLIA